MAYEVVTNLISKLLRSQGRLVAARLATAEGKHAEAKLGRSLPQTGSPEYEHERVEAYRHGLEPVAGATEVARQVRAG
jgi:hypothetical protein